ncbi:MAG: anti-sigma regulatory factor [Leptospiraceae bacterium]|nr:anti-sigma regulatory factor [Leptospiraceae bacterium]
MIKLYINDTASITQAILNSAKYAEETGFDIHSVGKIKTVVSELAYNIIKYAKNGTITLRRVKKFQNKGIEISSDDRGPGIADISKALKDRFSTGKTLGLGLPGIKRMSDEFEITSQVGKGTKVISRIWLSAKD